MTIQRLYGLNVDTTLDWGTPAMAGEAADLMIVMTPAATDQACQIEGRLIASLGGDEPFYELFCTGDSPVGHYVLRLHGLADLHIDREVTTVDVRLNQGVPEERLSVLLSGTVLAVMLMLRRLTVLHASAIERDAVVTALVGNSGAGKSTIAAMACLTGASLVSDDVLRVDTTGSTTSCYRGANSLRLRPTSQALANGLVEEERFSLDGRMLWAPERASRDLMPLDRVIIPRLSMADTDLALTQLSVREALFALLGIPRVHNWTDAVTASAQFDGLASLVEVTPVYRLDVPWGLDVDDAWLGQLSEALFHRTA